MNKNQEINIKQIKIGDILLYKKHRSDFLFGPQIVREQKRRGFNDYDSEFTHVELSSGDCHSVNIAPPKAKLIDITKTHNTRLVRVLRPNVYSQDHSDRLRLKCALIYNAISANQFYDWKGVLKFKIPFMFHAAKHFFCSEGVTFSIQKFFPNFMPGLKSYQVMPSHFTDKYQFKIIDEFTLEDN